MSKKLNTRVTLNGAPFAAGTTFSHMRTDGTVSTGVLTVAGPTVSLVVWDDDSRRFNLVYSRDLQGRQLKP